MSAAVMRQGMQGRWFGHKDFQAPEKHDIDCRTGGCWPSRTQPFTQGSGLTKHQVMEKTYELVLSNPREIICEITHWAHGYSYRAWRVDENAIMNFVRGTGDHALVYSTGSFRLANKVANSCWTI